MAAFNGRVFTDQFFFPGVLLGDRKGFVWSSVQSSDLLPDTILPVVSLVSPANLSNVVDGDAITVDVTDTDTLTSVTVFVTPTGPAEIAYSESAFKSVYLTLSTQAAITHGKRLVIKRDSWQIGDFTLTVIARDGRSNTRVATFSFTAEDPPPPDLGAPAITLVSP